jgi:pimeloyl-ACP methyl ester carboxylesterase
VFAHGFCMSMGAFHFQRARLEEQWGEQVRMVFYDHRGHGQSAQASTQTYTVGQLGRDLEDVLAVTAPRGPVVLVGHSMGGMTIMALARQHPELFGAKVTGAVLISTTAGGVDPTLWLPAPLRPVARQAAIPVLRGVSTGRRAALADRVRQAGGDLAFLGTRYIAFADPEVSPSVVEFLERLVRATPVAVVAAFYLALLQHDERAALGVLGRVPVTVVAGENDRLIPPASVEELAVGIPGAELVQVPGAGHAVILERPEIVNRAITELIARSRAGTGSGANDTGRRANGTAARPAPA